MTPTPRLGSQLPISVLTGFLGSGKTTLLGRALHGGLSETAVIINEVGKIALDHLAVEIVEGEILALSGGCLCCATRNDLSRTLLELLDKRRVGLVPHFRRVVIETSGLADPAPLLYTLAADLALDGAFALDTVLCVVDADFGEATLRRFSEARRQVAVADAILFSKTDRTQPNIRLRDAVRTLNRSSRPIALTADIDPAHLLFVDAPGQTARAAGWLSCDEVTPDMRHPAAIANHAIVLRGGVSRLDFAMALGRFAAARGENLLRLKGLIEFTDRSGRPAIINAVQHAIYPPAWLNSWPDEDQRNRMVVIGPDLTLAEILEAFKELDPQPLGLLARAQHKDLQCWTS